MAVRLRRMGLQRYWEWHFLKFRPLQNGYFDAVGLTTAVMGVTGIYKNISAIAKTWHYYAAAPLLMSKSHLIV